MAGLAGMDEEGRRSGRGERRRDLAADVPALAHAHDDDPAAAREHGAKRCQEAVALALLQCIERPRFDVERRARKLERAAGVEGG